MTSYLVVAALETRHQLRLVVVALLSALKRLFNVHFVVCGHVSVATKRLILNRSRGRDVNVRSGRFSTGVLIPGGATVFFPQVNVRVCSSLVTR